MKAGFGIYVIVTKPALSHAKIAEISVKRGVKIIQLREKDLPDKDLLNIAREMKSITRGSDTLLCINDRPDIAALCEADCLHLGQSDISINDARKIVGSMKIGLSSHSLQQANRAISQNPFYIGFGPIWPTPTKAIADRTVGVENLRKVLQISTVPVVAIGGIFPENLGEVISAGADTFASVRYLMQTVDFEKRLTELQNKLFMHIYKA